MTDLETDIQSKQLKSVLEGLIFVSPEPLGTAFLAGLTEKDPKQIQVLLDQLQSEYEARNRGFRLIRTAGGYQFRTLPQIAPYIIEMRKKRPQKLGRAALETLTIIAYNQPITRSQIEEIRGVESSATIKSLLDRNLIVMIGRKEVPGRPMLYGTSRRFLELLGIDDLSSLPQLPENEMLAGDELT
jgi:segregation and condensation protein B